MIWGIKSIPNQMTFSSLERYWQAMEDCGVRWSKQTYKPILKETSWWSKYSISPKKYVIQCDPHEKLHNIHGFNMNKLKQIHESMLVPFAPTI